MASGGKGFDMASLEEEIKKALGDKKEETKDFLFTAAIDFGTTFTGYAICVKQTMEICMSMFSSDALSSEKAPTCVLLDKDKHFVAFGYKAEEDYQRICEDEDERSEDYYFFERFKMALFETKKLKRDTLIKEYGGKELEAMHVFAEVIKHLTDCVYQNLHSRIAGVSSDEVLWVLTVPAIWSDAAKQFMREAANKAGIHDSQLRLILEPEAASLYCRSQNTCRVIKVDGSVKLEPLPVGQRYLVADLGGGTADIAVHEILQDSNLKEISRSDGDAHGGMQINRAFMQFLDDVFGQEVMSTFCKDVSSVMNLRRNFEVKKRRFEYTDENLIVFTLTGITEAVKNTKDADMSEIQNLALQKFENKIKFIKGDKLSVHPDLMKGFFQSALHGIITFIQKLRHENDLGIINTVLLVGGLSESKYVQHKIQNEIEGIRIIVPTDARLAVIKGAIIFGEEPKVITDRIARYSYGFSVAREFKINTDPENLKVIQNGVELCNQVFDKLITKGECVKKGGFRTSLVKKVACFDGLFSFMLSSALPVISKVYKSEETEPKYATEEHGSECIGMIFVTPPDGGWPLVALIAHGLVVGESELRAFAMDVQSKEIFEAKFDCL
ncbi:heat shock 70 kDa protein 12A-like [Dreissena polymorpha]|uniref:Uncharacterized protein n=1 Tax=Dreissena polymorpha TaxID=45954 RepID=A0A9D4QXW9_DREPO|nr:heat shock 70 kDa protein 12A-like [Dreissena polymorpha]KAH3847756.1 hypothetical protein DPMN_090087 [Dreissena polymorpha]